MRSPPPVIHSVESQGPRLFQLVGLPLVQKEVQGLQEAEGTEIEGVALQRPQLPGCCGEALSLARTARNVWLDPERVNPLTARQVLARGDPGLIQIRPEQDETGFGRGRIQAPEPAEKFGAWHTFMGAEEAGYRKGGPQFHPGATGACLPGGGRGRARTDMDGHGLLGCLP